MTEFDLNQYLHEQKSGGALDSEGEFTVDSAKAARKLARFSMPHEYSWVLKLVQSAVGWGAAGIEVKQNRERSSFVFEPASDVTVPTAKEVLSTILHGSLESQDPLSRLCIALRALVEQTGLSFVLGLRGREGETETLFAGPDASRLDSRTRKTWGSLPARGIRVTVSHQLRGEFYVGRYAPRFLLKERRDLAIADQLVKNAFCSPATVSLDGRSIENLLEHPEIGFHRELRPLLVLGLKEELESEDRLAIPVCAEPGRSMGLYQPLDYSDGIAVLQVLDPLHYSESGRSGRDWRSELFWIQDGVVVERAPLRIPGSRLARLVLILDAAGLETDLTGFTLLSDAGKDERLTRALFAARKLVSRYFEQNLDKLSLLRAELSAEDKRFESLRYRKKMAKQAVATSPLFLWNPLFAAGVISSGLFLHGVNRLFPRQDLEQIRDKQYRTELGEALANLTAG